MATQRPTSSDASTPGDRSAQDDARTEDARTEEDGTEAATGARTSEDEELERDEREEERHDWRATAWWERRRVDPEERRAVLGELFFEEGQRRPFLYRFTFLMTASVVIATMGMLADSAAVVIGAMLLAPLITPMLASAAALLMCWPRRVIASTLVVGSATIGSIALSAAVATLVPNAAIETVPQQVLLRTQPNILDLVVGLAAGAAGAYALVREELRTALPGVAIAVALLPPLAAVGVAWEIGRPDLAMGAGLLYLANGTAVVLGAGVVFVATGFVPTVRVSRMSWRMVLAVAVAALPVLVLSVPLTVSLQRAVADARLTAEAGDEVRAWLSNYPGWVEEVRIEDGTVMVSVTGPREPPPAGQLARQMSPSIDEFVEVRVTWTMGSRDSTLGASVGSPSDDISSLPSS